MVKKHICQKCGRVFKQKGHLTNHLNRKNPCKPVENVIVEEKVNEKIQEMIKKGEIEIKKKSRPMTFIDLFCGIGGFHQALTSLGAECNLACDIDKRCREVYENNYKIKPHSDIRKIIPDNIDNMDIICGGFPCQAFSNAGNKKTFSDDRGLLFDEIIKIAINKKPKFMFLENVKHILKVGNGEVIKYIKEKLEKHEYILQLFEMSPHNYGIPQQRERIYFVCIRKDIYNGKKIQLPISTKKVIFENYLDKKEDIDKKYFIDGDILKCLEAWDEMIKIFNVDEKISPTIMINEHYNNHSEEEFNNYAKWKKEYITKNKPLILKYKDKWDKWYKKHQDILKKREIYGKLEWQVGPIKPKDSIFNYFIQPRQSGIRVKKAQYFPTLVAIVQVPIYGKEKRYITPRECARLQSFPENFIIDEDDKKAYKQFGNAVNVDNVKTVIKATFDHYNINPKEYIN
jgi:DNA (cytosine-5)-methyltransferase 1